jgi:hypothetical protein
MQSNYKEICQKHNFKVKMFIKAKGPMRNKFSYPDLIVIFTNTVVHKMSMTAKREAKNNDIPITYLYSSSIHALEHALVGY